MHSCDKRSRLIVFLTSSITDLVKSLVPVRMIRTLSWCQDLNAIEEASRGSETIGVEVFDSDVGLASGVIVADVAANSIDLVVDVAGLLVDVELAFVLGGVVVCGIADAGGGEAGFLGVGYFGVVGLAG